MCIHVPNSLSCKIIPLDLILCFTKYTTGKNENVKAIKVNTGVPLVINLGTR